MSNDDHVYHHERRDMRGKAPLVCPHCGVTVSEGMLQDNLSACPFCHSPCQLQRDERGDMQLVRTAPETLHLPRGSVRAACTLIVAVATWALIVLGRDVPDYIFGLLLTLIAYYFALRKGEQNSRAAAHTANEGEKKEQPLYLPGGCIRGLLIAGFLLCGCIIGGRGLLTQMKYLEFFALLAGLIVGYAFSRILKPMQHEAPVIAFKHLKGVLVLIASLALAIALISGWHVPHPYACLGLACGISFYLGAGS